MAFNNKLIGQYVAIKGQVVAVLLTVLSLIVFSLPTQALEIGVSAHQGTEYETQGYSIFIANSFSRKSSFYWGLGFNRYDEVYVEWNDSNLKFPLNSAEASLSYRHQFSSRRARNGSLSMEFQVGAVAILTDNKFTWAKLGEEKSFSETSDINGFVSISGHYKMSSKVTAIMGVKHFPDMSEFGPITSVFLGFKYSFGSGQRYYGN